jgi:hypothetical protein
MWGNPSGGTVIYFERLVQHYPTPTSRPQTSPWDEMIKMIKDHFGLIGIYEKKGLMSRKIQLQDNAIPS